MPSINKTQSPHHSTENNSLASITCCRYIELNPVRAQGMVDHPSRYPWSSYHCNALGLDDINVKPHDLYLQLGNTDDDRQKAYRALFKSQIADITLKEIRQATNKAWLLGNRQFKQKIEKQLNRRVTPLPRGGDRKSKDYTERNEINRY